MAVIRIQEAASHRLDDIYRHTRERWVIEQADRYITGLFAAFDKIDNHGVLSRPIPAAYGVNGYVFRYEGHFIYWRRRGNADVVTIRHERIHQLNRSRDDFESNG